MMYFIVVAKLLANLYL